MSKFLMLDIGAGTMDVLYYDIDSGLHYKAVVKSPVMYMAEKVAGLWVSKCRCNCGHRSEAQPGKELPVANRNGSTSWG